MEICGIEETIKILGKFITEHKLFNIKHSDGLEQAIETLLTAYEKEKEKNKNLNWYFENQKDNFVHKDKIKAKMKEKEWSLENYDCNESDYKQSQAIGAWSVLQSLLKEE